MQVLTPDDPKIQGNLGLTLVSPQMSPVQGFGVEFVLGFVLVMVVFGVCDAHRPQIHIPAPLAIGLAVGLGHLAAVSVLFLTLPHSPFLVLILKLSAGASHRSQHEPSQDPGISHHCQHLDGSLGRYSNANRPSRGDVLNRHLFQVYITGPTIGGITAALIYQYLFRAAEEDEYSQVQVDERK